MMRTEVMRNCSRGRWPVLPSPCPHPSLPRQRARVREGGGGRVREGVPRRQRQWQRNNDAHASAAAVCCFNRKLAAERLNPLLHAAKPETLRLACRDAEAVVAHRQFQPCPFTSPRVRGEVDPNLPYPASGVGKVGVG